MLLRITSPTGSVININVVQVVVLSDEGTPVAYASGEGRQIVYADARDKDWSATVRSLGLNPPEVEQ